MPDIHFTWRGLWDHLRKYVWVYLVGIALCLFATNLLWTVTRPRLSNEQAVTICLAGPWSDPAPLQEVADEALRRTRPFDEGLKEVSFQSLHYDENQYTSQMLMVARLSVGECDAFFASRQALDALISAGILAPLDEAVAGGWPADGDMAPFRATLTDEETGRSETFLAALSLEGLDVLARLGAFDNRDAWLCVTRNGGNTETTMKALETVMAALWEKQAESRVER